MQAICQYLRLNCCFREPVYAASRTTAIEDGLARGFLGAGYSRIQIHTEYHRLPAIKTYLRLGYIPALYCEESVAQWQETCGVLDWPYTPDRWSDESVERIGVDEQEFRLPRAADIAGFFL